MSAHLHRRQCRRSRRGFTLMETMITVVIILTMGIIVAQSLRNSIEFNNVLSMRDSTARTARVALSRLKRDLQMAYLTPNKTIVARYQTVFVGLDESPDRLFFATLNHQRMYLNTRECDQSEVSIWTEPSTSASRRASTSTPTSRGGCSRWPTTCAVSR